MMVKKVSIILLVIFSETVCLPQTGGDNVYEFLNLTHSGLISSLGGSNVSLSGSGLNMSWHNPALLDSSSSGSLALNYSNYLAGINYGLVLYSPSLKGPGCLAAGITYLNYGSFTEADETGVITGSFSASEIALALMYSFHPDSMFSAGINFKPLVSQLEKYNSFGLAFDLGASWHNRDNYLSAGLAIRNLGIQLSSYAGEPKSSLPLEIIVGFSARLRHAPFRFSLTMRHLEKFKLTHHYNTDEYNKQNIGDIGENILRHAVAGVEIIPHKNFWLSFGYNHQRRSELKSDIKSSGTGFSWGFGINSTVARIEFGRASYHLAAASNNISVILMPGKMFNRKQL